MRGFEQKEGVVYFEILAPVVKWVTIRVIVALSAMFNWRRHHLDVKTTFLNGELEEEVYIHQPLALTTPGKLDQVCRLRKAVYGLCQAPRA